METTLSLFYLDDDYEDLDFFKEVAEDLGHEVRVFAEGRIMLLVLETEVEKPDVIFLDIHMPILNGQEILNIIKKSDTLKDIPIVMVSGAYPKKLVRHFSELGVNYFLKKHHVHDYRESLKELLEDHISSTKKKAKKIKA